MFVLFTLKEYTNLAVAEQSLVSFYVCQQYGGWLSGLVFL